MRISYAGTLVVLVALVGTSSASAQQPTPPRTRADSIAKARADSIALMRELGAAAAPTGAPAPAQQAGPANPRLLPDISAVGDFVADLSPKGSTQEDRSRIGVREVEVAIQAVVDPYFRGDIFLGVSDLEGIAIEQAFLTTTSLPNQLEARIGRFLMPFGKQNSTHRHDLHTIEYPYVIQNLFGPEGFKGTGLWGSRVFSPFGFFQEIQLTAVDRLTEADENLTANEPVNKSLTGLGFSARLRNYVDLSESQNVELSFSALTGKREQPLTASYTEELASRGLGINATNARQSTFGADFTYRWRPLQQGIYQSFILQSEVMHQRNDPTPLVPIYGNCFEACPLAETIEGSYAGPTRNYTGAYVFARYQTTQRTYLGSRYDWLQSPQNDGRTLKAGSVYLEWFPSEFSKLVAGYEALSNTGSDVVHRLLLQATFALGPHKPHPF